MRVSNVLAAFVLVAVVAFTALGWPQTVDQALGVFVFLSSVCTVCAASDWPGGINIAGVVAIVAMPLGLAGCSVFDSPHVKAVEKQVVHGVLDVAEAACIEAAKSVDVAVVAPFCGWMNDVAKQKVDAWIGQKRAAAARAGAARDAGAEGGAP